MSASGPIALCNRALTLVGGQTISSFLDGSTEAKLCSVHYDQVRDHVTAAYEWAHAVRRKGPLVPEADPPIYEYSFSYLLPPDLLRLVYATTNITPVLYRSDPPQLDKYAVEDHRLLANEGEGVYIRYLTRVTDTTRFSAMYTEALVARLAAELAQPIAESRALGQQMMQIYQMKVDEAATVDNLNQGRNKRTQAVRHMRARQIAGYMYAGWW